ncbi:MAG: transglutaminase N-terminal domain-containing protein [Chlorobium sp.]
MKVEHATLFEYDNPIYETATEVRLHPDNNPAAPQRCASFKLEVDPPATLFEYTDFYGNHVNHFNLLQSHKRVKIVATSVVETSMGISAAGEDEDIYLMGVTKPATPGAKSIAAKRKDGSGWIRPIKPSS